MDPFESLVSEFAGKAGLALQSGKDGSVDLVVDGVDVSVQYRPDRGDCVLFTLPLYDAEPEPCMQRRALEAIILTLNDFRSVLGKENDGNVVQTLDKRGIFGADFRGR